MQTNSLTPGKDFIGVGVGALIFNGKGKFFVSKRGPKARNEKGKWEIPGGKVEFGETLEQAIIRETQEEFGIVVKVVKLLQVCDHILPAEGQHWVSPTYICEIVSGTPMINEPEKSAEIGWYSIEEAKKLDLSEVTKHDVEFLEKHPELLQ